MPGKIHVPVTVATDGFDKLQRTFSRLKGVAIGVTAALGGLQVAAQALDFTGAAVQGARDLERNYAGLESVFKQNTDQMKAFGETASEMGLSMNEAAKATTFIGSVLKQSGFSIQETSDLTEQLVELGADLALTYGYDVQEALLGMTALFRGEYDPIEKFGVAMKQSEIDAEKAARGLDGLTGAAERFADQQIRVEFLMERAGDAMGAFERQSGNLTVQQMRLRAEFENIRDTVADDLLPPIADFTGGIREIVQRVGPRLEDFFDRLAPVIAQVGEEAIPLISSAINTALRFFSELIGFFEEAMDPSSDLNESLTNAGEKIGSLGERIGANLPTMEEQFDLLAGAVGGFADALGELAESIEIVFGPLFDLFGRLDKTVQAGTLTAVAGGLVAMKVGLKGIATVFTRHPILAGIFFGTMALGELGKRLKKDAEMTERYRETVEDLNYTQLENLDVQENAGALMLIQAEAAGELNETLAEYPDLEPLAKKIGLIGTAAGESTGEIRGTLSAAEHLAASDGLPTWLNGVMDNAKNAARELREAEIAAYALAIASGEIGASGSSAGEVPIDIDLDFFRKQQGIEEEVGDAARDYVAEFFDGIAEGIEKQAARLDLQDLGLSQALIDQILGSQGWAELFQTIIDGGEEMARQLQDDFNKTAAGIAETAKRMEELEEKLENLRQQEESLQQQLLQTKDARAEAIADATAEFDEFSESVNTTVDALETYERQIGRFESQTRSDLQRIEQQIMDAFDNGYLLEEAKDNLLDYARAELNVLMELQRQRDDLLRQRNAAADTIFGIAQAVTSAGNITTLLRDVQDEVKEVQVKELFEDVVQSADGLNGFKVTVERNYTDVITNTVSKSKALVNGFQDVIDRTKAFIANLKLLREMGLDPFLFNQLVQAGAEAGGATAQALVEGGTETVNEVNKLQNELEGLGVELGEETYEVTKNSGEQFVSGIIDGMDAELERLGEMAQTMATDFTTTFEILFKAGMESAFDGIIEGIRSEYQALIDELERELKAIQDRIDRAEQQADDAARNARVATGESIIVEGVEVVEGSSSIGPDNIGDLPASEQAFIRDAFPELFPGGGGGQTVNVYNVTANNPLDAYNASKGNVEQQSTYQSSNGDIAVTLAGVGN